ncbi:MAG: histidine ammonia-lyase [Candidatus Polarisedimenticolia bacterium]|nr:histidine ammonia-lyase [bacterium]
MSDETIFKYGVDHMTVATALHLARGERRGTLTAEARERMAASRRRVEELAAGEAAVYGVNTGFGPLCTSRISPEDTRQLQLNLLMSHSCGMGAPVAPLVSRLMLVLKAHALCQGHSGVAVATVERILWHLENDVVPVVPSQGSVGASGDLAPLSHLFLPLVGLGKVWDGETQRPAGEALAARGVAPIDLGPKEALGLINGTQFIAAHATLAAARLHACLETADIAGAMSLEAFAGTARPFGADLHEVRPHEGIRHVASHLAALLRGSQMCAAHAHCGRVQDPYSLRCMPQIHGASRQAWRHFRDVLEVELNSVTDNPVILATGEAVSGGHFHGQPLALPIDYATLAAAELGNVSDRRVYLMLFGDGGKLPRLLLEETGLQSGYMIPQYVSAALVSENKTLCFPASADSVPTSLGQEDHVSMGSIGGRKLNRVIDNLQRILAVELVCAAQGMEFRRPLRSTPALEAVHARLREAVPFSTKDHVLSDDLAAAETLVRDGSLLAAARKAAPSDEGVLFAEEFALR